MRKLTAAVPAALPAVVTLVRTMVARTALAAVLGSALAATVLPAAVASTFPPSDPGSRKALIDADPDAFRAAFDSTLAAVGPADLTHMPSLEAGAAEYLEATGDSLLVADYRFAAGASKEDLADWYRAVALDDSALALRNAGDYPASADAFRKAAEIYRRVGHLRREAVAWGSLGVSIWYTGDLEGVGKAYAQALAARERLGDPVLIGRTLNGLGSVNFRLGNYREALDYYQRARAVRETLGNPVDLGATLTYIGHVESELGNLEDARSNYRRALELFGNDAPARRLNEVRGGLANVYAALGEYDKALGTYRAVLASAEAEGDSSLAALTRTNLSDVLSDQGDYTGALRELNAARDIQEATGDAYYLTHTLNAMGVVYQNLGDIPKALAAYQEARKTGEASDNVQETAFVLINQGSTYSDMGLYDRALTTYEEAVAANRKLESPGGVRSALLGKAVVLERQNKTNDALALYQQILGMDSDIPGNRAEDLVNIANVLGTLGRYDESRERYRESLGLAVDRGLERIVWPSYLGIADSYEREGVLDSARVYNDRAIAIMETMKGSALSEETRAAFLGQRAYVYEAQIHVLAKLHDAHPGAGYAEAAFRTAEEGKAQALQEMLAEGSMDLDAGTPPALAEERDHTDRLIRTVQNQLRQGDADPDSTRALTRRLGALEKSMASIQEQIRLQNPRLATLETGKPVTLEALRHALLTRDDACVLEYALGDSASYLWVITQKDLRLFRLPPREAVETVARTLRTALASPEPAGDATFIEAAASLYRMILEPAAPLLSGIRSAVIVPDGALHFVPFDALLTETPAPPDSAAGPEARGTYLSRLPYAFRETSLDYGPSAATVMTLTALQQKRDRSQAPMAFLGVGDPVFHEGGGSDSQDLAPLPFTRDEVTRIAERFKPKEETVLLGKDASEARLLAPGFLGRYRILHFATHGLIDERHPERSRLALSYPQDPSEDGYLQASEIYGLRLNADLVVLSACETGRGRLVRGEGVLGLPRAFFYAGAPSVVVSLWSVSDRSTTRLMQGFYEQLVGKKHPAAEALSRAKDDLRRNPEFAHPFYWAPFVLMGAS